MDKPKIVLFVDKLFRRLLVKMFYPRDKFRILNSVAVAMKKVDTKFMQNICQAGRSHQYKKRRLEKDA